MSKESFWWWSLLSDLRERESLMLVHSHNHRSDDSVIEKDFAYSSGRCLRYRLVICSVEAVGSWAEAGWERRNVDRRW